MSQSYHFQSQRVILRAFEPEDLSSLHTYLNHPDLLGRRYLPWGFPDDAPLSKKKLEAVLEKWGKEEDGFNLAVVLQDTQKVIGHAGCDWGWDLHCPDMTLVIDPVHQRQGYGSEVLHILLNYLYEQTPAHNVSVWMADWNHPARQFAEKYGFRECGQWRRAGLRGGAFFDMVQMDILRAEWLARKEVV